MPGQDLSLRVAELPGRTESSKGRDYQTEYQRRLYHFDSISTASGNNEDNNPAAQQVAFKMGIYENMQPLTWVVTIPFVVVTSFSCLLRFYSRIYIAKYFGSDDWWMVAGSIVWLGQQVILGQMISYGGGRIQKDVPDGNMAKITLLLFIEEFVYILAQFLIKMSFLQFYIRVLNGTRRYRMVCHFVTAFVVLQTIGVWLLYGLQCLPIDAFFHPAAHPDAKCISTEFSLYFPASLNVFADLLIYILPIYPIWNLQMSARRRLGLLACFTVGGGTIIVSLLRFIVLKQLAEGSRTSYVYGSVCIVTTIEFCTAILTANMPALRPVWRKHISHSLSTGEVGYDHSSHHELGNVSAIRSRKPGRGSVALRSQSPHGNQHWPSGSEEELFKEGKGKIVVSTKVDVTSQTNVASDEIPDNYYNFPTNPESRTS